MRRVALAILLALAWAAPARAQSAYLSITVPEPAGAIITVEVEVRAGRIVYFEAWEEDIGNDTPECQGSIRHLTCRLTAGRDTYLGVAWAPERPAYCGRAPQIVFRDATRRVLAEDRHPPAFACAYLPLVAR